MKNPHEISQDALRRRHHAIKTYRSKADARRTWTEKFADFVTSKLGSVTFLLANILWFSAWISINNGFWPGIAPFDPFPYGLLTMAVSLEAIFLAIIVLISQNRLAKIDEVREEAELQIDSITETEIAKVIQLLMLLLEKEGINVKNDPELAEMLRPMSSDEIEAILERQLS